MLYCAGIFKQSMGARNRERIVLSTARQASYAGGIDSLESILGLLKSLENRALIACMREVLCVKHDGLWRHWNDRKAFFDKTMMERR